MLLTHSKMIVSKYPIKVCQNQQCFIKKLLKILLLMTLRGLLNITVL
jgi:hypothetical protein